MDFNISLLYDSVPAASIFSDFQMRRKVISVSPPLNLIRLKNNETKNSFGILRLKYSFYLLALVNLLLKWTRFDL